jgi:inosine/xanthosine triphosphatase
MKIAIASTRAPKVNGVQRAFRKAAALLPVAFEDVVFSMHSIESGVADTPKSIGELTDGARIRAVTLYEMLDGHVDIAVGVEGGLYSSGETVFLQSWTCVYDGIHHAFGSSGSIEIPASLAHAVMEKGADLGNVIDGFAEQHDVRSNQGTWGVLTNDLVTREDSFELATMIALMPFLNRAMYAKELEDSNGK